MKLVIEMTDAEREAFLNSFVRENFSSPIVSTLDETEPISRIIIERNSHHSQSKKTEINVDDMPGAYIINVLRQQLDVYGARDAMDDELFHAFIYKLAELFEEMDAEKEIGTSPTCPSAGTSADKSAVKWWTVQKTR